MNNTLLRSCSVVGSSLCSTLRSCHISGEPSLLMKASTLWRETETMEVFRKVPQQPHFRPLEKFLPELREGLAYGLMVAYASLVVSVNKSSIEDSIASFKEKISALAHFQENGFDVESLHHILNKLLETKLDHSKHVVHLDKLKESVPGKVSLLNEKEKTALQLQQELESVCVEAEQSARELLRLKAEVNTTQEACSGDELRFRSILAELRSTLQLSD